MDEILPVAVKREEAEDCGYGLLTELLGTELQELVREILLTLPVATSGAGLEREHDQVRLRLRLGRLGDRGRKEACQLFGVKAANELEEEVEQARAGLLQARVAVGSDSARVEEVHSSNECAHCWILQCAVCARRVFPVLANAITPRFHSQS